MHMHIYLLILIHSKLVHTNRNSFEPAKILDLHAYNSWGPQSTAAARDTPSMRRRRRRRRQGMQPNAEKWHEAMQNAFPVMMWYVVPSLQLKLMPERMMMLMLMSSSSSRAVASRRTRLMSMIMSGRAIGIGSGAGTPSTVSVTGTRTGNCNWWWQSQRGGWNWWG